MESSNLIDESSTLMTEDGDLCFVEVAGTVEIGFQEDKLKIEEDGVALIPSMIDQCTLNRTDESTKEVKSIHLKRVPNDESDSAKEDNDVECYTDMHVKHDAVEMNNHESGFKCKLCKRWLASEAVFEHHSCKSNSFTCFDCNKSFATNAQLKVHHRIHTGVKPYKCSTCSKCFAQSATLVQHIRTHTGERPYKCVYCAKAFTTMGNLNLHQKIHTGEKPFKCTYCDKMFRLHGDLKKHIVVHTGERAFKCAICSKAYKQQSQLSVHRKTHNSSKPTSKPLRKCVACGEQFTNQKLLQKHLVDSHIRVILSNIEHQDGDTAAFQIELDTITE